MNGPDLPELIRIDLNPDGSVTLMLTDPVHKFGLVKFGPPHLTLPVTLKLMIVTLPYEDTRETLGFRLIDEAGEAFFVETLKPDALEWGRRILDHLQRPQPTPPAT